MLKKLWERWQKYNQNRMAHLLDTDSESEAWNVRTTPTVEDIRRIKSRFRILGMTYFILGIGAAIYFPLNLYFLRQSSGYKGTLSIVAVAFFLPVALLGFLGLELFFLKKFAYYGMCVMGFLPLALGYAMYSQGFQTGPIAFLIGALLTGYTLKTLLPTKTSRFFDQHQMNSQL